MQAQAPLAIAQTQCYVIIRHETLVTSSKFKSVERTYKISELAESGILPCVNLNFILWFLPSHSKLFILMVTSNLKTVTTINFLQ